MILIVCGVSGSGKTTTGRLLSEALDIPCFDADDFYPALNIEKMVSGHPPDDADRLPWLETIVGKLPGWENEGGAVLACSAPEESCRVKLQSKCGESIRWVFLDVPEAVLADRLASRKGCFFDQNLLDFQLYVL